MAKEYEELVETESLLNETQVAQDAKEPELLNRTVVAAKHLRFTETYENVDYVADYIIAQGEIEGYKDRIALYKDRLARLRRLEELKQEALKNPGATSEIEKEMNKVKDELNETIKYDNAHLGQGLAKLECFMGFES